MRFRALCDTMRVGKHVGDRHRGLPRRPQRPRVHRRSRAGICGAPITILSGKREAELSALGVISGIHKPDGIVGDLGGGSLELTDVHGDARQGRRDAAARRPRAAGHCPAKSLEEGGEDRRATRSHGLDCSRTARAATSTRSAAPGGRWRGCTCGRPAIRSMSCMAIVIPAREALEFSRLVHRVDPETLSKIEDRHRRPPPAARLCGAGAGEHLVRRARPKQVVVSALGVREGLALFAARGDAEQKRDPLIAAAAGAQRAALALAARTARNSTDWTDRFMASSGIDETAEEKRLRHAACLLGDIGWRAHPDYRGEQSLNIISHAAFIGVDHPGPRLPRARGVISATSAWAKTNCRRICANSRPRACSTAPACSAPPCGSPTSSPAAMPACCRRRRCVVEARQAEAAAAAARPRVWRRADVRRLRQLARLIGREPVIQT